MAVIFATAYDAYALRAFEVNAVDYLLKPFSAERLAAALARARERIGRKSKVASTSLTAAAREPGTFATRIVVRDGPRVVIIPVEQLDYAKGQGDYVELFSGERSYLKQQTMQSLADSLDGKQFVRIHRSYVLNVARLARIEPWGADSKVAVLTSGAQLPMSRSGCVRLNEILGGGGA